MKKKSLHSGKRNPSNPIVFFDISVVQEAHSKRESRQIGRLQLELFADAVPKTAENFRQLCTGEHVYQGTQLGYKNVPFHRIVSGLAVMGGDCLNGDGSGAMSIYGTFFDDESFAVQHDAKGIITMSTSGPHRNSCQFMFLAKDAPDLNGRNVAFGRVILEDEESSAVLEAMLQFGSASGTPAAKVVVDQCGEM